MKHIIDNMNTEFFQQRTKDGGMPAFGLPGLAAGCTRALRFLMIRGGMLPDVKTALQKRELEKKLRANGYDKRLAKIAVSETFLDRSNPI